MYKNPPTEAPQVSTVVQVTKYAPSVTVNIFTGKLQGILGLTNAQVRILADDGYDSQELVLYWKITEEWCQLKSKITESHSGIYFVDMNIRCLQALDLWVTDLTLRGKIIDLNNFKTDILADAIEDSRIDFEDTRNGKKDLSKPKEFSHKIGLNGKI